MNFSSKVAVIILNWNNLDDTSRCIDSLLDADVCVYLADNGSTDGSKEVLWNKYSDESGILLIDNGRNLGFAAGCNRAIAQAYLDERQYIILLNNDCIIPDSNIFLRVVQDFKSDERIGIIGGKILFWPETELIWSTGGFVSYLGGEVHIGHRDYDSEKYNGVFERTFISGAFMCIRREVIDRIGLLPEAYFFGKEEWEYSLCAYKAGYKLIYDSELVVWHEASSSHSWTDPFYVWNGNLSKILFKKRNYPAGSFYAWLLMYWFYVFVFLRFRYSISREKYVQGIPDSVIRSLTLKAIYDSFNLNKISLEDTEKFRKGYAQAK